VLDDVSRLYEVLGKASIALAAMFCSQVLQKPMAWMDRQNRRRILVDFGIDLALLGDEGGNAAARRYTTVACRDQLRNFCTQFAKVQATYHDVLRDANMTVKPPAADSMRTAIE